MVYSDLSNLTSCYVILPFLILGDRMGRFHWKKTGWGGFTVEGYRMGGFNMKGHSMWWIHCRRWQDGRVVWKWNMKGGGCFTIHCRLKTTLVSYHRLHFGNMNSDMNMNFQRDNIFNTITHPQWQSRFHTTANECWSCAVCAGRCAHDADDILIDLNSNIIVIWQDGHEITIPSRRPRLLLVSI